MPALIKNITIEQGAKFDKPFCIRTQGDEPVNLTGAQAAMQIRADYGTTPLLTLLTSDGSLVIDAVKGTITPNIAAGTTNAFLPGAYVYDLGLFETNGRTSRPFQGAVTVSPEVTIYPFPAPSPSPSPSPSPNAYTAEDGTTVLTGEDGTTILNQES